MIQQANDSQHPYRAGALLSLRLHGSNESCRPSIVTVKILKPQDKWTLSCGMVVEVLGDPTTLDGNAKVESDSSRQVEKDAEEQVDDDVNGNNNNGVDKNNNGIDDNNNDVDDNNNVDDNNDVVDNDNVDDDNDVEDNDKSAGRSDHGASSPPKLAFLKLYDRRFATGLRDDHEYAKMVLRDEVEDFVAKLSDDEWRDETEYNWTEGENEACLAHEMRKMFEAETTMYARLVDIQGVMVPRFLGSVEVDIVPAGLVLSEEQRELFMVKGILLEYIPGFCLSEVVDNVKPEACQDIVDQAVCIAHALCDRDVLNTDVRPGNFIVTRVDDVDSAMNKGTAEEESEDRVKDRQRNRYQTVMIDFGQSRLRREDESDATWGRLKWQQDEVGAVGQVMQHRLKKAGIKIAYDRSFRYLEFAEKEDEEFEMMPMRSQ